MSGESSLGVFAIKGAPQLVQYIALALFSAPHRMQNIVLSFLLALSRLAKQID